MWATAVTPQPVNLPPIPTSSLSKALPDRPLSHSDYPLVRYWFRKDWINWKKEKSAAVKVDPSLPMSKGRGPQGVNVTMHYMENESGDVVDGYCTSEMRKFARSIWTQLKAAKKAPKSWGKAELDVAVHYRREMCRHFPEFALCELDWKAEQLATDNYPNWVANNLAVVKEESSDTAQTKRRGDSVDRVSKRPKTIESDTLPSDTAPPAPSLLANTPSSSSVAVVPPMVLTTTTPSAASPNDTVVLTAGKLGLKSMTESNTGMITDLAIIPSFTVPTTVSTTMVSTTSPAITVDTVHLTEELGSKDRIESNTKMVMPANSSLPAVITPTTLPATASINPAITIDPAILNGVQTKVGTEGSSFFLNNAQSLPSEGVITPANMLSFSSSATAPATVPTTSVMSPAISVALGLTDSSSVFRPNQIPAYWLQPLEKRMGSTTLHLH